MTWPRPGIVHLLFALFATASGCVTDSASKTQVDPQYLVGEWGGTWQLQPQVQYNGPYYLTIEKVDGNQVTGKGWASSPRVFEWRFRGTLDGNRLIYADMAGVTTVELTIYGNTMEGPARSTAFPAHTIRLRKMK